MAAARRCADHAEHPLPRTADGPRQHAGAGRPIAVGRVRAVPPRGAINVDRYGDAVPVPASGPRMVCMRCGIIGAGTRPNLAGEADERKPDRAAGAVTASILLDRVATVLLLP